MSQSEHQDPYGEVAKSGVAIVALSEIELAQLNRAMDVFMERRRPPEQYTRPTIRDLSIDVGSLPSVRWEI
jgi:hypothetical protein